MPPNPPSQQFGAPFQPPSQFPQYPAQPPANNNSGYNLNPSFNNLSISGGAMNNAGGGIGNNQMRMQGSSEQDFGDFEGVSSHQQYSPPVQQSAPPAAAVPSKWGEISGLVDLGGIKSNNELKSKDMKSVISQQQSSEASFAGLDGFSKGVAGTGGASMSYKPMPMNMGGGSGMNMNMGMGMGTSTMPPMSMAPRPGAPGMGMGPNSGMPYGAPAQGFPGAPQMSYGGAQQGQPYGFNQPQMGGFTQPQMGGFPNPQQMMPGQYPPQQQNFPQQGYPQQHQQQQNAGFNQGFNF